jgi:hypothetical protein
VLPPDVITCIRESLRAELPPRDAGARLRIQASQRQLAARGLGLSGNAIHEQAQIGCDELSVRAEIIWTMIQRCYRANGPDVGETLLADLQQQITEFVTAEAPVVIGLVNTAAGVPDRVRNHIPDAVMTRRNELISRLSNEARFYVQAVRQAPQAERPGVVIQGNVGAVQMGAHAIAHVHVDAKGSPRLIEALEQLRAAIAQAPEMSAEQREESVEVVGDLVVTVSAPKPNGSKIVALLNGLAVTVQTVAAVRGAWDLVRDAARAMGIPVP